VCQERPNRIPKQTARALLQRLSCERSRVRQVSSWVSPMIENEGPHPPCCSEGGAESLPGTSFSRFGLLRGNQMQTAAAMNADQASGAWRSIIQIELQLQKLQTSSLPTLRTARRTLFVGSLREEQNQRLGHTANLSVIFGQKLSNPLGFNRIQDICRLFP